MSDRMPIDSTREPRPDAFISSCFANPATKPSKLLSMCVASACSLRQHHPTHAAKADFVYLVNAELPESVREQLRRHVDELTVVPPMQWPRSAGKAPAPDRLYSFLKLTMWRMSKYSRLLYFDPDVFWTGDAWRYFERYGHTAHLAAAQYTDDLVPAFWRTTGMPYINSGILLLRPSEREYASLVRRWHLGNFTAMQDTLQDPKAKRPIGGLAGRSKASEQDLIVAHFHERLTPMDMCENFRGYVKGSTAGQARCRPSSIIAWHGVRFRHKATCRRPDSPIAVPKSLKEWEASWRARTRAADHGDALAPPPHS